MFCKIELSLTVALDANELVDDTGRIRIEIIDLDVQVLGSFVCLAAFQIVITAAGELCILASTSEAVFHSPSAALDQQLSIPPAQTVTKSKHDQGPGALQRDFLIVVQQLPRWFHSYLQSQTAFIQAGDRLVHKAQSVGQLLRFEAFHLTTDSPSTSTRGKRLSCNCTLIFII